MEGQARAESRFPLIDLRTQAEVVTRRVRGWTKPQILAWLRQRGEVLEPDLPDSLPRGLTDEQRHQLGPPNYHFRSCVGLWTTFRFLNDDTFEVLW